MNTLRCLAVAWILGLLPSVLAAQTESSPVAGATPPALAPGTPDASYALSQLESINSYNGHLTFHVPLLHIGGRGETGYTMYATIEKTWYVQSVDYGGGVFSHLPLDAYWNSIDAGYGAGVLFPRTAKSIGVDGCGNVAPDATLTRMTMRYADHTEEELIDQLTNGNFKSTSPCGYGAYDPVTSNGSVFLSHGGEGDRYNIDGTFYDLGSDGSNAGSGTFIRRNGLRYRIENQQVKNITDRNGNIVQFAYDISLRVSQITDALGHTITVTYRSTSAGCDVISYSGTDGAARQIQVCYEQNFASNDDAPALNTLFGWSGVPDSKYNPFVIRRIVLADGNQYHFSYNGYGELIRADLPTGGAYAYEHKSGDPSQSADGIMGSFESPFIYRRVSKRTVYNNPSSVESVTTYSPSYNPLTIDNVNLGEEVVTEQTNDSAGHGAAAKKHYFYGAPNSSLHYYPNDISYAPWREGLEYKTEEYDDSGSTLLQRASETWQQRDCLADEACPLASSPQTGPQANDPRRVQSDTLLADSGQVFRRIFGYDRYNNVTDDYQYDWGAGGPGGLLRHMQTGYVTGGYVASGVWIVNLPDTVTVKNGNDVIVAKTHYGYDEYGQGSSALLTGPSGIVGHDDANYGSGVIVRGNLTNPANCLDIAHDCPPSGYINHVRDYDIFGNGVRQYDGNNNATVFSYDGNSCSQSLPATVTNALGQTATLAYDCNISKPSSSTDANYVATAYAYSDGLDRLTQVRRAADVSGAESQTNYSYPDANHVFAYTDQKMKADEALRVDTVYDGLGRVSATLQYGDPAGLIETDTTYDALGRVYSVSNPYRPTETVYLTTTKYDALGRVKEMKTSGDGATVTTSYSGNQSTVTDQAGKKRTMTYDALERLTQVVEDSGTGGVNYATNYVYDALDNLKSVTQDGQVRSFTYDAVRRLLTASNPESGTVTYSYDNVGNLVSKTDARGRITCYGSLTGASCASGYDALNRLTRKSYYPDGTPTVTYTYDTGATKGVGRLTKVSNASAVSQYTEFDELGRVKQSSQQTAGQTYPFIYTYNLAGGMTSETYPSGRMVSTSYDGVNRVQGISATTTQSPTPTQYTGATPIVYAAHGAMQTLVRGDGLTESWSYNNRLQATSISVGGGGNPRSAFGLDLYYCPDKATGCTTNNGNLLTASLPVLGVDQNFGYDGVNRLVAASEGSGWSQAYNYDRYANRWVGGTLVLDPFTPTASTNFDANNRLVIQNSGYDAAGNLTGIGGYSFSWDGEGRQVTSNINDAQTIYSYDGEGRRVRKQFGAGTTVFVYDAGGNLASEYSTAANTPMCTTCYLSADPLGSTRLVTDANGAVVARHDYLPFGEEILPPYGGRSSTLHFGATENIAQKFTGKERDSETGLDWFEARYMSSAQGRFTSPDPMTGSPSDPQSWNMYSYARNNPLLYTDPDGQTYRICDTSRNCDDDYSDANFDKNLGKTSKNGTIYDSNGNKIGTYQRTSFDDLGPLGNSFYLGMAARRQASNQFVGAFAVGSVALGTGGALAVNAVGLTAGAGLTIVNLQGAAQAAALTLPAGAKLAQMIARSGNSQFIGNPQGFLSFAREFVETAVKQGAYAAGDYISKAGSTIYRVGNDFLTVARDGRILSYVQGANAGGVAAKYSQLGGK